MKKYVLVALLCLCSLCLSACGHHNNEYIVIEKEDRVSTVLGNILRIEFEAEDRDGVRLKVTGYYWYDTDPTICCFEVANDLERNSEVEEMLLGLVYKRSLQNTQPYPDGHVYEPDVDEAMRSLVEDAWEDYNREESDISDRVVKP